jgi:hypothetical protein
MLSPTAVASVDNRLDLFARADDSKLWRSASFDRGAHWPGGWSLVNEGTLSASFGPSAAASGDGRIVHLLGRSSDNGDKRIWHCKVR